MASTEPEYYSADGTQIDQTQTPEFILQEYNRCCRAVYGAENQVHYMGYGWYQVNNEVVHRMVILGEIQRLTELIAQARQPVTSAPKSVVKRLIDKLKRM
ncbi:MAG: hypothetical protein GYB67_11595 [Chloroflexi bacterium]|nr:hypothetical protein [Chloroflexota bacterium]